MVPPHMQATAFYARHHVCYSAYMPRQNGSKSADFQLRNFLGDGLPKFLTQFYKLGAP